MMMLFIEVSLSLTTYLWIFLNSWHCIIGVTLYITTFPNSSENIAFYHVIKVIMKMPK